MNTQVSTTPGSCLEVKACAICHIAQGSKDTVSDDVLLRTYTPGLVTFEEEIKQIMEEHKAAAHSKKVETASTDS